MVVAVQGAPAYRLTTFLFTSSLLTTHDRESRTHQHGSCPRRTNYAKAHEMTPFLVYQGKWSVLERSFERDITPMARAEGFALAPYCDVLCGGKIRSDAEEARRRKTGEKGRTVFGGPKWERAEEERNVCLVPRTRADRKEGRGGEYSCRCVISQRRMRASCDRMTPCTRLHMCSSWSVDGRWSVSSRMARRQISRSLPNKSDALRAQSPSNLVLSFVRTLIQLPVTI